MLRRESHDAQAVHTKELSDIVREQCEIVVKRRSTDDQVMSADHLTLIAQLSMKLCMASCHVNCKIENVDCCENRFYES